jgi:hypothetical protein
MFDYKSARGEWRALLEWHVTINGTRPSGNQQLLGKPWRYDELALACNVGDPRSPRDAARTVRNWFREQDTVVPGNVTPIERALMGENTEYYEWRRDLREAHRLALIARRVKKPLGATSAPRQLEKEPEASSDEDSVLFRLFKWEGSQCTMTPSFVRALGERARSKEVISTILMPEPYMDTLKGSLTPEGGWRLDELLEHLIAPEFFGFVLYTDTFYSALGKAKHLVHVSLRDKAVHWGLFEFVNDAKKVEILRRNGLSRYRISGRLLEDALSQMSMKLSPTPSRVELLSLIFDELKAAVGLRLRRKNISEPHYVDILSLFLFAYAYDGKMIAAAERSWVKNESD